VWNNANLVAGQIIYIDVFSIQQPFLTDINTGTKMIGCAIDSDSNYTNGVDGYQEVSDTVILPLVNSATKISILSTSVDNYYIRSTQTLTININMSAVNVFAAGGNIYLEFPVSYAEWISRAQNITTSDGSCFFKTTTINLATACMYISTRLLKITVASTNAQTFTLIIKNVKTPS
jgi:hypothetical protein